MSPNQNIYKGGLVGYFMKQINIYLDDKIHEKFDKIKKENKLTWQGVLELGINELIKKGGTKK